MKNAPNKERLKRYFFVFLFIAAVLDFGVYIAIDCVYDYYEPTVRQPASGKIYAISTTQGNEVYVTAQQAALVRWLSWSGFLFMALALGFFFSFDPMHKLEGTIFRPRH